MLDGHLGVTLEGTWREALQSWTVKLPEPLIPGMPDIVKVLLPPLAAPQLVFAPCASLSARLAALGSPGLPG